MPKKIYNNWLGGLTPNSENIGPPGSYAEARDVDPHREPGFIEPGWADTNETSSTGGVLTNLILDAVACPTDDGNFNSSNVYATDADHLYQITSFATAFTNSSPWPQDLPSGKDGKGVVFYQIGGTWYLLCIMNTDIARMANDDTWVGDYLTGAGTLNDNALNDAPHPHLLWKTFLWIGNGKYLSKFDGPNEVWTEDALELPADWEITALFPTQNYIGICAWRKQEGGSLWKTESAVFMWDGTSSDWNYQIPIEDNKITSAFNNSGDIYLITEGRSFASTLRKLTDAGTSVLKHLKTFVGGTTTYFYNSSLPTVSNCNTIDVFQNRIIFTGRSPNPYNYIFAYGKTLPEFPDVLIQPYSHSGTPSTMGYLGHLARGSIYLSRYDGTNYYWARFPGGDSTNALLKEKYEDFGQKIRINYVKFYFKPLVASDSVTVSLDTDYGTANSLGTITYTTDGAATKKRFNKYIACHAFRPVIDWSAGGVAFSKIVVDYDFVSDTG